MGTRNAYRIEEKPHNGRPEVETAFRFRVRTSAEYNKGSVDKWRLLRKGCIRLELQIGQLIRIVANMNERINDIEEDGKKSKNTFFMDERVRPERV